MQLRMSWLSLLLCRCRHVPGHTLIVERSLKQLFSRSFNRGMECSIPNRCCINRNQTGGLSGECAHLNKLPFESSCILVLALPFGRLTVLCHSERSIPVTIARVGSDATERDSENRGSCSISACSFGRVVWSQDAPEGLLTVEERLESPAADPHQAKEVGSCAGRCTTVAWHVWT